MEQTFDLHWIDYAIMLIYFVFVLGIGWVLKRYMKDANAFLLSVLLGITTVTVHMKHV